MDMVGKPDEDQSAAPTYLNLNEPGCQPEQQADSYSGIILEQPDPRSDQPREGIYGRSSGVVGLRLFKNPAFNDEARKKWDVKRYFEDKSYDTDPKLVRPYRVGMSCGFCHVAPHPLNPPVDPEEPKWENLSSIIGNQYFRTRAIVGSLRMLAQLLTGPATDGWLI